MRKHGEQIVNVEELLTENLGYEGEANYLGDASEETKQVATALAEVAQTSVFMVAPYLRSAARSRPDFDLKRSFHDIVTEHDRHVEDLFRSFFAQVIPGSLVLGEEAGEQQASTPVDSPTVEETLAALDPQVVSLVSELGSRVRFIVDPIDGTANFASGLTHFGSSIGVELDGQMVAAAVSTPCLREAIVGDSENVWHVLESGERENVVCAGPEKESEALLVSYYPRRKYMAEDPMRSVENELALFEEYSVVRRPGAGALDLANVAAGWVGALIGTAFAPWDVAAGIHLIRVAGGHALNLPMGTDLPYGLRPCVVASVSTLDAKTAKRIALEQQLIDSEQA